jgi:hypothetical protein
LLAHSHLAQQLHTLAGVRCRMLHAKSHQHAKHSNTAQLEKVQTFQPDRSKQAAERWWAGLVRASGHGRRSTLSAKLASP